MSAESWAEIHELFDSDDGSLPEIRVDFARGDGAALGFALLRSRAASSRGQASFWSRTRDEECALDSVPAAAELVARGEADPFHVVLCGIRSRGVTIPDLGVFVSGDQLALDYRMGAGWGHDTLQALFELLAELVRPDPGASLSLEEAVLPEVAARFHRTWRRWSAQPAP